MTLTDVLKGYLRLSPEDHVLFGRVQTDLPEVLRAVTYIRDRPPLLQGPATDEFGQLERALSARWGCPHLSRTVMDTLDVPVPHADQDDLPLVQPPPAATTLDTPLPAAPAHPAAPVETPEALSPAAQHLKRLLDAGMRLPDIARQINDRGGSVSRGQLKRAQRHTEPLPESAAQVLLGIHPPEENTAALHMELQAAAAHLGLDAQGLRQVIQDAHAAQATPATQAALATLSRIGEARVNQLLSGDGNIAASEQDSVRLLTSLLEDIHATRHFVSELRRLQDLGWNPTTLTPTLRRLGWTGSAIDQFQPSDLAQVRGLTGVLAQVTAAPDVQDLNPPPPQDLAFPLTTTAERERYVNDLLDANGTVATNDLTAAFGMRGLAVSSFLRDTMKLHSVGNAVYRRKR